MYTYNALSRFISSGLAGTYQPGLLGVYTLDQNDFGRNMSGHHRHVFRHVETNNNWLYYWDWGPNSGTNWMVDIFTAFKCQSEVSIQVK